MFKTLNFLATKMHIRASLLWSYAGQEMRIRASLLWSYAGQGEHKGFSQQKNEHKSAL